MKFRPIFAWYVLCAIGICVACNKPSIIGKDLIAGEQLNVYYTEDIPMNLSTVKGDSTLSYNIGAILSGHPCGIFRDPIFGTVQSEIYAELGLQFRNWDFTGLNSAQVNELDLILPYNSDFSYGNLTAEHSFEVYQITETPEVSENYYSNDTFMIAQPPIGTYTGLANPFDSISILDYSPVDTVLETRYPHLRIPIEGDFKERFIRLIAIDTFNVENDSLFQANVLRGLYIRPTQETPGMPVFDLQSAQAGIRMVYEDDSNNDGEVTDAERRQYLFALSPIIYGQNKVSMVNIDHDYTDSFVEEYVDNKSTKDTMFVQGMEGLYGRVEFANLDTFTNVVINQAVLEIELLDLPNDDRLAYPPVDRIRVLYRNQDGVLTVIEDYTNILASNQDATSIIGGEVETLADGTQLYRLNISNHFQEIISAEVESEIFIQAVFPQAQRIGRMALGNPRLKLTYTQL